MGKRFTQTIQARPPLSDQKDHFMARSVRAISRNEVSGHEDEEADGEHSIDAHHRRVAVVGRELGADLPVADDGKVDQEPEDAGADEVPEADRPQEHDRPLVRKTLVAGVHHRLAGLGAAEAHEPPRLEG